MKLLRPKDVADILNCSVSEVYHLKDRGKIPWCKIGGMVRFRPEDVEHFIQSSVVKVQSEPRKAPTVRLKNIRI
jgi:excisionase family DNA binding protein